MILFEKGNTLNPESQDSGGHHPAPVPSPRLPKAPRSICSSPGLFPELLQLSWAYLGWQRLLKPSQAFFSNLFFDSFKQSFAQALKMLHVILGTLPSGWNLGASAALNPKR